ncbi:hypothetical protein K492DRAFT_116211, partial [Lichtheimia hyalospora FSU 10163]
TDEWCIWTVIHSPFLLKQKLESDLFDNWLRFVEAVRLLCQPSITRHQIDQAHHQLLKFFKGCVRLYGEDFITPNMHLHGYLKETIEDFGPIYGYWLFSFERYNGMVKNISTNNKDRFELTYMKQFLRNTLT